jgi:hypothetical protein
MLPRLGPGHRVPAFEVRMDMRSWLVPLGDDARIRTTLWEAGTMARELGTIAVSAAGAGETGAEFGKRVGNARLGGTSYCSASSMSCSSGSWARQTSFSIKPPHEGQQNWRNCTASRMKRCGSPMRMLAAWMGRSTR